MFVFPACILGDIFDASICCEKPRNPCLLDDSYPYSGRVWDFHPWHLSLIDLIFDSCVHWVHKNLPRRLERLVWIRSHLGEIYFTMGNLSVFQPNLEGDILICHLHDPFILHDVIIILHSTFHGDGFFMMLMILRKMHIRHWDPGIPWDVKFPPLTLPHG